MRRRTRHTTPSATRPWLSGSTRSSWIRTRALEKQGTPEHIVNAVVPKQELLDAQMELALARLEHQISRDAGPIPVAPLASELAE